MSKEPTEKESTKSLLEYVERPWQNAQPDSESRILRNVCLLGPTSRNGRRYPESTLREALALFDGCKAYLNHPALADARPGACRDVRDLVGRYESPRVQEGRLRADLRILPQHADLILALAAQMPDAVGMSINARGRTVSRNGEEIVETLTEVKSVDLVTDPAATNSLFESIQVSPPESQETVEWKEISLGSLSIKRPDLIESIEKPLHEKIGEYQAKEESATRREKALKAIEEAKLPKATITEVFIQTLMETKDSKSLRALIEDRARLLRTPGAPQTESREKTIWGDSKGPSDQEMYGTRQ